MFKFIDWIIVLPEGLKKSFWQELKAYEEEKQVTYITSVEEIGFERGIEQGIERGIERERSLIIRLLIRRVGELPAGLQSQVEALPLDSLEALGEALLDFSSLEDLLAWLAAAAEN